MKKQVSPFLQFLKKRIARAKRHARLFHPTEKYADPKQKAEEYIFFWKISSLATLGLFFFSLVPQIASSYQEYVPYDALLESQHESSFTFLDGGFLMKPELPTEVGDRSDVGGSVQYIVKDGDTLSEIAERFGVSTETISENNGFFNVHSLRPGMTLVIPSVDGVVHTVAKGETISNIAKKYKSEPSKILAQNNIKDGDSLFTGQKLVIPGARIARPKPPKPTPSTAKPKTQTGNPNIFATNTHNTIAPRSAGRLQFPTKGVYTQGFHSGHYAVDIAHNGGGPIFAAESGTVIKAKGGWNGGYGNMIMIDHGGGMVTLYAHNKELYVKKGDRVVRGQTIAYMGNTGKVRGRTGIHLHFEVRINGVKKDPRSYF